MNPFANLSVVSGIGLLTLFALAIPIAIHLLSKTTGKLIKFADISLIGNMQQKPVAQIYLTQRKLLFLRLLLLFLLSMLLSQCVWQSARSNKAAQSARLVSPLWIKTATTEQKLSLANAENNPIENQNVFLLTDGYSVLSRAQLLDPAFANSLQVQPTNTWMRAQQFSLNKPHLTNTKIYVTNSLHQFIGSKIPTTNTYEWHVLPQSEQSSTDFDINIIGPINVVIVSDQDGKQGESRSERKWRHALTMIQQTVINNVKIHEVSASEYTQQNDIDWVIDFSQQLTLSKFLSLNGLIEFEDLPHFPLILAEKLLSKQQYKLDLLSLKVTKDQLNNTSTKSLSTEPLTGLRSINTATNVNAAKPQTPLIKWLYLLLLICFCVERIVSERSKETDSSFIRKEVN